MRTEDELLKQSRLLLAACEAREGGGEQPDLIRACAVELVKAKPNDGAVLELIGAVESFKHTTGQAAWTAAAKRVVAISITIAGEPS